MAERRPRDSRRDDDRIDGRQAVTLALLFGTFQLRVWLLSSNRPRGNFFVLCLAAS
jgi:hypothetical protein